MRLIVHIGGRKTGSTSLQRFLKGNASALRERGLFVTETFNPEDDSIFPNRFLTNLDDPGLWNGWLEEMRAAREAGCDRALISAESLTDLTAQEVEAFAAFFRPHCESFRIVFYLRRQDIVAVSHYSTALRGGGTSDGLMSHRMGGRGTRGFHYKATADVWAGIFGKDALTLRVFPDPRPAGWSILDDIAPLLELDDIATLPAPKADCNTRLRASQIAYLRAFNLHMGEDARLGAPDLQKAFLAHIGDLASGPRVPRPARRDAEKFYRMFRAENEALRATYLPDRPAPLFGEDFSDYPQHPLALGDFFDESDFRKRLQTFVPPSGEEIPKSAPEQHRRELHEDVMSLDYLFVGFSVTEQRTGYFPQLQKMVQDRGESCGILSMGGATFGDLSFFTDVMNLEARYVVFEIATCRRFTGRFEYERYFSYLADAACRAGAIPCFFNLPREGYIAPDDDLDTRIRAFAREHGFPVCSLYPEMSELERQGTVDTYLRDRTHTTDAGSELYARHALDFIDRIRTTDAKPDFRYMPEDGIWPTWLDVTKVCDRTDVGTFTRRGFELPVVAVPEGETVTCKLPPNVDVAAIVAILGPLTGDYKMTSGGKDATVRAYDRDCHYRRIAFLRCPAHDETLSFTQLPGRPDIKMTKNEPDDSPRLGELAGFLVYETRDAGAPNRDRAEPAAEPVTDLPGLEYLAPAQAAERAVGALVAQGRDYERVSIPSPELPGAQVRGAASVEILVGKSAFELFRAGKSRLTIEIARGSEGHPFIYVGRFQGTIALTIRSDDCAFILDDCKNISLRVNMYAASYMQIGAQCSCNSCEATVSGASIIMGSDCMLSHDILLQPSDQHDIFDAETGRLLNSKRSIVLGDHVWLAKACYLGAGVTIGSGAVVEAHSVVTKSVDEGVIVAGNPAREIRRGVTWTREFTPRP